MTKETQVCRCNECGSENIFPTVLDARGDLRYLCEDCGTSGVLSSRNVYTGRRIMQTATAGKKTKIRALVISFGIGILIYIMGKLSTVIFADVPLSFLIPLLYSYVLILVDVYLSKILNLRILRTLVLMSMAVTSVMGTVTAVKAYEYAQVIWRYELGTDSTESDPIPEGTNPVCLDSSFSGKIEQLDLSTPVPSYTPTATPQPSQTTNVAPSNTSTIIPLTTPMPIYTTKPIEVSMTPPDSATPWPTLTYTPTVTVLPSSTVAFTPTSTVLPSYTSTNSPSPTETFIPTVISTSTSTGINTATPTSTPWPPYTPTKTPLPTWTKAFTGTPTHIVTSTSLPTSTTTPTPTIAVTPLPTYTSTPVSSPTPTPTAIHSPTLPNTSTPMWTSTPLPTHTPRPTPLDDDNGEGCTPGYWKNHSKAWGPTGYSPGDDFDATFGVDLFTADITLEQAVNMQGGGVERLARHGTAALLNAAHPDVDYALKVTWVIAFVQAGDAHRLAEFNDLVCPLD